MHPKKKLDTIEDHHNKHIILGSILLMKKNEKMEINISSDNSWTQ